MEWAGLLRDAAISQKTKGSAVLEPLQARWAWLLSTAHVSNGLMAREKQVQQQNGRWPDICLLYTSPSPRDRTRSRMPSSA